MMDLIDPRVAAYLDALVPPRSPILARMEAEAAETGFPIIGPACGHLCYLLARIADAREVCELGSGFGYSTAWFARAVRENGGGVVHHIVWDEAMSLRARRHLDGLGVGEHVRYHVGEAVATLRELAGPFDIVFNDIDKHAYPEALDVIESKLRAGGLLIADNLLWSGRIFDDTDHSPATEGIRAFTERIRTDPRWAPAVLPVRDGLLVARWQPEAAA